MKKLVYIIGIFFLFVFLISLCTGPDKETESSAKVAAVEEKPLTREELKELESKRKADQLEARKAYKELLRNNFLDNGLDIKVDVKGKNKDHLYLHFALFNDVWARKFQTSGNTDQWREMGFKKVTLTDGFDYNSEITWSN